MTNNKIHTILVEETSSTNALAKELLKQDIHSLPFLVQTHFQTGGKGQYSKVWESNNGENLLCSLVIKAPKIDIEKQFDISKAVAIGIQQVLRQYCKNVCIKWPNDIYIDNHKIAGVLIENTIIGTKLDTCIIGIGLNINQTEFNNDLPNPTSLKIQTGNEQDLESIKNYIIDAIFSSLSSLDMVNEKYNKYLYRKGELGRFIDDSDNEFLGVITGIDKLGKLLIRTENSQIRSFANNEIQFILPETN